MFKYAVFTCSIDGEEYVVSLETIKEIKVIKQCDSTMFEIFYKDGTNQYVSDALSFR